MADRVDVLRKGVLVQVAGGSRDAGAEVHALAFLDLRFADGHVERWLGPGLIGAFPSGPDAMAELLAWAQGADEFAGDVAAEAARDFDVISPAEVRRLPPGEVVVEWNAVFEPF